MVSIQKKNDNFLGILTIWDYVVYFHLQRKDDMDEKLIQQFNLVPLEGTATANQIYSSGCDLMKAKYYREALDYFNMAIDKVNRNTLPPTYLRNLGWTYFNLKEYKAAKTNYEDALKRFVNIATKDQATDQFLQLRIDDCKKMLSNIKVAAPGDYFDSN